MSKQDFIGLVPPAQLEPFLPRVCGLLSRAEGFGTTHSVDDLIQEVREERSFLLVYITAAGSLRAAAVVTVVEYPRERVLHIAYGAGREMRKLFALCQWVARTLECSRIDALCRPAVARLFVQAGFSAPQVRVTYELET